MPNAQRNEALIHTIIERRETSAGFKKGQSGNPGGRPKTKLISEALRQELETIERNGDHTMAQKIARRLIANALMGKPSESNIAVGVIADRTEGKAIQQVRITQTIDENTAQRLVDLAERLGVNGVQP